MHLRGRGHLGECPVQGHLRQQGLMLLDTSQPGWRILHSDCDEPRLSPRRTEGQALWDVFAVPDVVRPFMLAFPPSTQTAVFAYG